jgi:ubiquinone/menaquinone biosynthesis C-methylase UbiE
LFIPAIKEEGPVSQHDDYRGYAGDAARKQKHLRILAQVVQEHKQRVYGLLKVQTGHRVLDVGCGPGTDTIPFAQLVGPAGQVVGIDMDEAMIVAANRQAQEAGVSDRVQHKLGDASSMPFGDNYFDACHAERVFMHLRNPDQVLAGMIRVTKPGGRIVVTDPDGASISFDTPEADIERRIVLFWAKKHNNGYAARQLYRLFKQQGLTEITVAITPVVMTDHDLALYLLNADDVERIAMESGSVTRAEVHRWRASLERAAATETFFGTWNNVTVVGQRP